MSSPSSQVQPARGYSATAIGVLLTVFVLVVLDLVRMRLHAPYLSSGTGALAFFAVASTTGALLGGVALLVREELLRKLASFAFIGSAVVGAVDALVLVLLGFFAQDPRNASPNLRVLLSFALIGALVGTKWFLATRSARLERWLRPACSLACIAACSWMMGQLRWNGDDWFRLALHLVLAACVIDLVRLQSARLPRPRVVLAMASLVALLLLSASTLLRASPQARLALHHRASHARSWVHAAERVFDWDGDGAIALFGGSAALAVPLVAERGADEAHIERVRAVATSRVLDAPSLANQKGLFGSAADRDILLISLDSLRWDAIEHLPELRTALGPHLLFELAVSPATATKESLSGTLRGRPLRQLNFEQGPLTGGPILWRDPSPTLAHVLQPAGYRAVTVPTSHVGDPRNGMAAGFETIWVANYDARAQAPAKPPPVQTFVAAQEALPVLLEAARETRGPLCAWVHLMEPHAPYRLSDASRCNRAKPVDCYRAALRETSQRLAGFIREFTSSRGKEPIIAVFGDHGEEFGEHGGDFHGSSLHAEQVRVGFMLSVPGLKAARVATPVSTASLPATLLELLGLTVPTSMVEPSLLPSIAGERAWPAIAASELRLGSHFMIAYTGARFRYLHDPVHGVEMLFDLERDPLEQRNLAADPVALGSMRELARTWEPSVFAVAGREMQRSIVKSP
jgi:hypothetical protein